VQITSASSTETESLILICGAAGPGEPVVGPRDVDCRVPPGPSAGLRPRSPPSNTDAPVESDRGAAVERASSAAAVDVEVDVETPAEEAGDASVHTFDADAVALPALPSLKTNVVDWASN